MLGAGNFPKHRTICDFRALHLQELAALFVQVVKLAQECGLVRLGTIAVDGTKLKANASKHMAMSHGRMQAAEAELKVRIQSCATDHSSPCREAAEWPMNRPCGIAVLAMSQV